jgi:Tubulin-tyrosine ligase family
LLIKKRKFDIRVWVLVAHDGKCYMYKEGYIRTSSDTFDISPESLDKAFIHLTNNAVQKFNENYGSFEEGN